MPWIVDGSNLGGALGGARGARDRVAVWRRVFTWAGGRRRVVLVFDGAPEAAVPARLGTVEVRFATGRAADDVVVELISARPREWQVVTDDRSLALVCRDLGAKVVGSRAWLDGLPVRSRTARSVPGEVTPAVDVDDWLEWFAREQ